MHVLFFRTTSDLDMSILDISKSFHSLQANKYNIALMVLHDMSGMKISEEIATLMHKLYTSEHIFQNLFRR